MPGETRPNRLRDDEIYAKRMRGAATSSLALEYGLTQAHIRQIVRQVARSLPERDRSELLALSIDQLADIQEKVNALYNVDPSPVFVGKDGEIARDEDGSVVRDYALRRSALQMMHDVNKTFAKRLGLDAPAQSEVKASVQYQIEGIDPEDLT